LISFRSNHQKPESEEDQKRDDDHDHPRRGQRRTPVHVEGGRSRRRQKKTVHHTQGNSTRLYSKSPTPAILRQEIVQLRDFTEGGYFLQYGRTRRVSAVKTTYRTALANDLAILDAGIQELLEVGIDPVSRGLPRLLRSATD
jgi:hypothetical protein